MKAHCLLILSLQTSLFAAQFPLDQYIAQQGDCVIEGHMIPESKKEHFFIQLFQEHPNIRLIAETGFNAGHSSECFLTHQKNSSVVSFDIMKWSYAFVGKKYIDQKFPNRHQLVQGDSLVKVVEYARNFPDRRFDFVFIDGGHGYEVAKGDILNFRKLSNSRTLLVVDDLQAQSVMSAWQDSINEGVVKPIQYFSDESTQWALGQYLFE